MEILQSIRQSEMTPMLNRIYSTDGGSEALDVLMKYMSVYVMVHPLSLLTLASYKGMSQSSPGSKAVSPQTTGFSQIPGRSIGGNEGGGMSVLLSWHEKVGLSIRICGESNSQQVVEVAGLGCVMRVMTDRRTV